MIWSHIKSAVLVILVAISIVFSALLWQGIWQNTSDLGLTESPTLTMSKEPQLNEVTMPYQVVLHTAKSNRFSVLVPNSPEYRNWLLQLHLASLSGLHPVIALPTAQMKYSVEFDFGVELTNPLLARWVPALETSALATQGQVVQLFIVDGSRKVTFAVESGTGTYIAETNLSQSVFRALARSTARSTPWLSWYPPGGGYVPAASIYMTESRWKTSMPTLSPLVHSFFVNLSALTRIQQDPGTLIWTDGSRVVWWTQGNQTITYEDPNDSPSTPERSDLFTAVQYTRSHGGGPGGAIALDGQETSTSGTSTAFVFRPYVHGYPILDGLSDYEIEVDAGHVIRYHRPLLELSKEVHDTSVRILGANRILSIVRKLVPAAQLPASSIQLGYFMQPLAAGQVQLTPVYYVTESGMALWTIDAQSGKVLKGLSGQ